MLNGLIVPILVDGIKVACHVFEDELLAKARARTLFTTVLVPDGSKKRVVVDRPPALKKKRIQKAVIEELRDKGAL